MQHEMRGSWQYIIRQTLSFIPAIAPPPYGNSVVSAAALRSQFTLQCLYDKRIGEDMEGIVSSLGFVRKTEEPTGNDARQKLK
jgi:hypothetical protein